MGFDRRREAAVLVILVGLSLSLSGCCQYPGRCDQRPAASRPADSHRTPARKYPHGVRDPSRPEPTWRELPVLAVDVRKEPTARHLIVKTRTPTDGWTVRVKSLRVDERNEAEFQVVGLAPAASDDRRLEERTVYREVRLNPGVEHVVVRGSEGSLLMDIE